MEPTVRPSSRRVAGAIAVWLVATGVAFAGLLNYGNVPGTVGQVPQVWPTLPAFTFSAQRPTLLVFAHPLCPCTDATINELARLHARVVGKADLTVLFFLPRGADDSWKRSRLWQAAERIPGTTVLTDSNGDLARAFGAETSGHTLLYDSQGQLVFSGGITAARAHEGDNRGCDAIRTYLEEGIVLESRTPVFGCELLDTACASCDEALDG